MNHSALSGCYPPNLITGKTAKVIRDDAKPKARARPRPTLDERGLNKTEQRYAEELELRKQAGAIVEWRWQPLKLRLADKTFYNLDFAVIENDLTITLIDVKGHWEDDARVKFKVAAQQFWMFRFLAVQPRKQKDGGGWKVEEL